MARICLYQSLKYLCQRFLLYCASPLTFPFRRFAREVRSVVDTNTHTNTHAWTAAHRCVDVEDVALAQSQRPTAWTRFSGCARLAEV